MIWVYKNNNYAETFEDNSESKKPSEDFGGVVNKRFAWFPKVINYSDKSSFKVVVWLQFYTEKENYSLAGNRFSIGSISNSSLNNFVSISSSGILPFRVAIEALNYYNCNRKKIAKMLKDTASTDITPSNSPSVHSLGNWTASNWKYLAIQSNLLNRKMLEGEFVSLTEFLEDLSVYK